MALNKLGEYTTRSTKNNNNLQYGSELILGVTNEGVFAPSKADTADVNLKPYKIVENGAFVYNPSRLDIGSIAYREEGLCIVSHLYQVFYLNEIGQKQINPKWLFMYFKRKEFLREVSFRNFGSQRPEFNYNDMSDLEIDLPPIEIQQKVVDVYLAMVANQKVYEKGLDDLKLTCDAYIEKLRQNQKCISIGSYIKLRNEKNSNGKVKEIRGISKDGFIPAKREMDSERPLIMNIVRKSDFVYNPSKLIVGSIGIWNKDYPIIVSPIYTVFFIENLDLLPEYLLLWFKREDFKRYSSFYTGGIYEQFNWNEMVEFKIPIPNISIQRDIVDVYKAYEKRRKINDELKKRINEICSVLIKGSIDLNK